MSTSYSISRDVIISAALRKLGVLDLGTTPDATTVTNAAQSLNILIKAWQSAGIKLWTIQNYTVTLVSGQKDYIIGPTGTTGVSLVTDKPLKIIQGWNRNNSVTPAIDTPLNPLSRQEYNILGSKSSSGMINSFWYEPSTTYGTVHVYLTPDATMATNYTLVLVGQRPLGDVSLSTDIPEFPNEWMQALVWGLADELAIEYDVPVNHRAEIGSKAVKYRTDLEDWDVEINSTFFTPDQRFKGK